MTSDQAQLSFDGEGGEVKKKAGKPGGVWSDDTIRCLLLGGGGCTGTRMQSSLCMKYFPDGGGSHGRQGGNGDASGKVSLK